MLAQAVTLLSLLGLAAIVLVAAHGDFRRFVIPNRLSLALASLAPVYWGAATAAGYITPPSIWLVLVLALAVFALGFGLFAAGVMGGGDIKLMTALALWMTPGQAVRVFFVISLAGGVLALAMALARLWQARAQASITERGEQSAWQVLSKQPIPYGVAIAAGGLALAGELIVNALTQ
ncbi:MAG: A24 family peptidase [Pseudomonadota bacterium]